jgi:hypothetical protein
MTTKTPSRIKELRGHLAEKVTEAKGLSNAWKDEDGKFVVSKAEHGNYVKALADIEEIKGLIVGEETLSGMDAYLGAPEGTSIKGGFIGGGGNAATVDAAQRGGGFEGKSLSDLWLASDAFAEMKGQDFHLTRGGTRFQNPGRSIADLAATAQVKDVYSAMGGTISIPALGTAQNLGLTERTLRPGRVRDLFPSERTNASMLYGIRQTGFTNNARTVAERRAANGVDAPTGGPTDVYGLKPRSDMAIDVETYPIATIAHIMYVHKNTLADEPRIRGLIDRDMIDGVKMAEDEQILWGDGVGENLTGLMNTDGVQEYTGLAKDRKSAQIRRSATRAILAYFQPTGVVMHPFDWEDIELETDNNGAYTVAVSVAVGGEKRVWRLAVTDTPAMTQGHALIGAFGTGAKLYDREEVNIEVSTENRDLFERNAYTLRAEERVGLVVDRPESFVHLDFTAFDPEAA